MKDSARFFLLIGLTAGVVLVTMRTHFFRVRTYSEGAVSDGHVTTMNQMDDSSYFNADKHKNNKQGNDYYNSDYKPRRARPTNIPSTRDEPLPRNTDIGLEAVEDSPRASQNPQQSEQQEEGVIEELIRKSGASYPDWWEDAWAKSAVYKHRDKFVGDQPLFEACTNRASKKGLYSFVEPPEYLPSDISKNPCWYEVPSSQKGLKCAPYVYLAGVAKCGTTDIAKRLKLHPDVMQGTLKEYHWWERNRFGSYDEDNPEKTVDTTGGKSFREYVNQITGEEIIRVQREIRDNGSSVSIFGDYSPSYLWDPQNWYALQGNQGCKEPRVVVGHHIRHVYPPAKIIFTFRHPTPRLYSRFTSRIHRTPDLKKSTNKDFHRYVKEGIGHYMTCFRRHSIRQCAYNVSVYKDSVVRLVEGMYPVFMADWLRIWPKEQMLIMRYEDYGGHERERLQEVMDFLELGPVNRRRMDRMLEMDPVNSGTERYEMYGQMLPETKEILDEFYRPFVLQFARLMKDRRFLWQDVYQ